MFAFTRFMMDSMSRHDSSSAAVSRYSISTSRANSSGVETFSSPRAAAAASIIFATQEGIAQSESVQQTIHRVHAHQVEALIGRSVVTADDHFFDRVALNQDRNLNRTRRGKNGMAVVRIDAARLQID